LLLSKKQDNCKKKKRGRRDVEEETLLSTSALKKRGGRCLWEKGGNLSPFFARRGKEKGGGASKEKKGGKDFETIAKRRKSPDKERREGAGVLHQQHDTGWKKILGKDSALTIQSCLFRGKITEGCAGEGRGEGCYYVFRQGCGAGGRKERL